LSDYKRSKYSKKSQFCGLNVGVVIPALNEEKNLEQLLVKLRKFGYNKILVIDGKSTDRTIEVARKHGATVILQDGNGKGDAVREVLNNGYMDVEALVLMDADGSMAPEEIPVFVRALSSGADLVKGSRFLKGGYTHDMSLLRRFGNRLFISAVNLLYSARYTDLCYGFAVFSRKSIKMIAPLLQSQNFEIETEIFVKAKKLGLKVTEVPSTEFRRKEGKSNLNAFTDGYKILKTILREIKQQKFVSIPNLN
jgi:glycosyltransferase involved in cell wall biosynthesis